VPDSLILKKRLREGHDRCQVTQQLRSNEGLSGAALALGPAAARKTNKNPKPSSTLREEHMGTNICAEDS
jgi:hypothetical protein